VLNPGQSFGNYRILEQIGVGGMGAVYLAQHPLIGKKVALKVIHNELSANKEVISRFFNEAKAANQIGHDHIVSIHDFGQTDDGQHFYIMEFIEGRTLASVLVERRTLHPQRCLHITAQIASGLAAAHNANIIHRDLKPDNVMLVNRMGDADFVKILDFGLAKILDSQKQLTAIGVVLGTPQYMSPEACESRRDLDSRSDIYSLGILMFQMLTGRVPFEGNSMGEVLVKQVTKLPPAPRALNPAVPPSVEQIVLRCLAKDRGTRFQNMGELRNAVLDPEKYLASSPPVVLAAGEVTGQRPKATQFFHGAADNSAAPAGPVGHAQSDTGDNQPGKTAYFAGAAPSQVARAAAAVAAELEAEDQSAAAIDRGAATTNQRPAHALKTQYAAQPAGGPPPAAMGSRAPDPLPAAAAAHAQKTMFVPQQGSGPPAAAPPPAAPANGSAPPDASTVFGEGASPPSVIQTLPPTEAKTAYMDPGAGVGAPPASPVMPELRPPHTAKNVTMAIAPPEGYKEHPPTSSGKLIAAVAVGVSLIGIAILGFVTPGFFHSDSGAGEADGAVAAVDAAASKTAVTPDASPPKAIDAAPATAKIEVTSSPEGAEVLGPDGDVLATTPGVIELPIDGVERTLTFRHPDAEPQTTAITPTGPALVSIELETRAQREKKKKQRERKKKKKKKKKNNKTGADDGTINPFK
jgi:serine/threonine-protein kinase